MAEKFTDTPLLTERFDRALALASDHHRQQLRKGTDVPYAAHLLAVTSLVLEMGGDEDEAIGGLLHDAVEDGGGAPLLARIRGEYGDAVAAIVDANSDSDVEPKPPWRERKEAYVAAMTTKSPAALRVSLADKLHNARSIVADHARVGDELWERFSASREETCWYYAALAAAFEARADELGDGAAGALGELRRLVDAMAG
jgi:(p)ppGpp synthase/HD superfamily hydrolase